jgi:hypothetical protein
VPEGVPVTCNNIQTVPSDLPGWPALLGKFHTMLGGGATDPPGIVVGPYDSKVKPAGTLSEMLKPAPFA